MKLIIFIIITAIIVFPIFIQDAYSLNYPILLPLGHVSRICDADRVIGNCLGAEEADVTVTVSADRKLHYAFEVSDNDGQRIEVGDITDWECQLNAGSFFDLTTTSETNCGVRLATSDDAGFVDADGVPAVDRLTTTCGVGSFVFDGLQEHETSSNLAIPVLGARIRDDCGETQASIEIVFASVADLDTITFRILQETKDDVQTLVGLAVITIDKAGADPNADQFMNTGCCLFFISPIQHLINILFWWY